MLNISILIVWTMDVIFPTFRKTISIERENLTLIKFSFIKGKRSQRNKKELTQISYFHFAVDFALSSRCHMLGRLNRLDGFNLLERFGDKR